MSNNKYILNRNHVFEMLMFALENEGFAVSDTQNVVATNYKTLADVCTLLEEDRLLTTRAFRRSKVVEQFYLTERGRAAALLLKTAAQVINGTAATDKGPVREFLTARYGEDALDGMEWQERIPLESAVLEEGAASRKTKGAAPAATGAEQQGR